MRGHLFVVWQWKVKGISWSCISFSSPTELSSELLLRPGVLENPFRESANLHLGCSIDAKAARTSTGSHAGAWINKHIHRATFILQQSC